MEAFVIFKPSNAMNAVCQRHERRSEGRKE